jgi:hypothetical protein
MNEDEAIGALAMITAPMPTQSNEHDRRTRRCRAQRSGRNEASAVASVAMTVQILQ